jgi:5-methylcytosine-specific restriction endonuclease McrA
MTTKVGGLSDGELVASLKVLVGEERRLSAAMLEHLGEVDARQLYLPAACSSMHRYCVEMLGMAEDVAFKRIRAARAARRFPVVFEAVATGRLSVSAVVWIAPHLEDENAAELVAEVGGMSRAEIEVVLARRAPRPDTPPSCQRKPEQGEWVEPGPVAPPVPPRAKVKPLAPERFELKLTVSGETKEKLERAQALLRHQVPSGDLAEVLDRALDALLDKVEKKKFGKTERPRAAKESRSRRHVPSAVRREVVERDGQRCSFVSEDGRRCQETRFLELDHVTPVSRGGGATSGEAVRILCRGHNKHEAERILGAETVRRGREKSALERDVLSALRNLGWSAADARAALAKSEGAEVMERVRSALRVLGRIDRDRRGTRCRQPGVAWRRSGDGEPGAGNRDAHRPCDGRGM